MTSAADPGYRAPDHYENLDAVLSTAWQMLVDGATNRRTVAHTPTVVTIRADGQPRARTVVLRGCDRDAAQLRFHTDRRSPKIAELRADPRAMLHIYDPGAKVQLQLDCRAELHIDDDVSNAAWDAAQAMSRICYQVSTAPGTEIETPALAQFDPDTTNGGADNFMVVTLNIEAIEWLFLDARGHRRVRFTRSGDTLDGAWLVP